MHSAAAAAAAVVDGLQPHMPCWRLLLVIRTSRVALLLPQTSLCTVSLRVPVSVSHLRYSFQLAGCVRSLMSVRHTPLRLLDVGMSPDKYHREVLQGC